ncbi:glyoxalase, partial [Thioclava sp. BHET1]
MFIRDRPWIVNAVAVSDDGRMFLSLPHWPTSADSPSVAEVMPDGKLKPFPGGKVNAWKPGGDSANELVDVNTIHIFDGKTLWVVDDGRYLHGPRAGGDKAQKLMQFDIKTGKLLKTYYFSKEVMPENGTINDLRMDAGYIYVTDSGVGGIIVIDRKTGTMLRRLSEDKFTKADPKRPPYGEDGLPLVGKNGEMAEVNSDPIELGPKDEWLYFATLTGPMYRVPTKLLRDPEVSNADVEKAVEFYYDTPPITGTAMDTKGNLYLAEMDRPRITVVHPDGSLSVLAESSKLWGPDALFIDTKR